MDVLRPLTSYISKITECTSQSKVLYLDATTRGIVAQLLSQSNALAQDIFLIHNLGTDIPSHVTASNLSHLSGIIFVRPTERNLKEIIKHLNDPKHSKYYIYFSNILEDSSLGRLAQADKFEVVQQIQEQFADIYPLNTDLWDLQQSSQMCFYQEEKQWTVGAQENFDREVQGLYAFLLAVKKRPLIRWAKSSTSHLPNKMADRIREIIETEKDLFGWSEPSVKPLLLIYDRKQDPITPLLTQWTYQAMVHELIGIDNSRVKLKCDKSKNVSGINEIVLNPFNDDFFRKNKSATFGDLGSNIKKLVDKFAVKVKGAKSIKSIQDMQTFVESYPEYLAQQGNVSKHVAAMSQLSSIVSTRKLLDLSQLEQEIVCECDVNKHYNQLEKVISDPSVNEYDKLRISLIFSLRYEIKGKSKISGLKNVLRQNIQDPKLNQDIRLIDVFLNNFGVKNRDISLFSDQKNDDKHIFGKIGSLVKSVKSGLQDVQNIYTQHNPLLRSIIENAVKCKLPFSQFPSFQGTHKRQPENIIIYIVGGATYEEAETVTQLNKHYGKAINIVLGSGVIHNSKSFIDDVRTNMGKHYFLNDPNS